MAKLSKAKYRRVKTPNILQMEAVECGAASLAIIMAHHGRYISLEQLRTECDVNRDGSKASNLVKAGRLHGFTSKGFKKETADVLQMKFPLLIHWNFNHFLVLEGFRKGKAFLNDPAAGHRTVSMEEFDESFTGVVLSFEKGEQFEKKGYKSNLYTTLKQKIKGYGLAILFIIIIGLLGVVPGLVVPVFSRIFVDDILIGGHTDWFYPMLIAMGITALYKAAITWLRRKYLLRTRVKMNLNWSAEFFWHVLHLPVGYFHQRFAGDIASRMSINTSFSRLLTGSLARTFLNLITVVFYFMLMLQYDVILTLVGVTLAMINILIVRMISSKKIEIYRAYSQASGQLMGVSMGGLQMIETLKATGRENDFFVKWAGYMAKVINEEQRLAVMSLTLGVWPRILKSMNTLWILVYGALLVMDGYMTIGMLVAFRSLMSSFQSPISSLVKLGNRLQKAEANMSRLDDVMQAELDPLVMDSKDRVKLPMEEISHKLQGYIEFKNVTFGYSKLGGPLIKDFNLKIKPGQRVALVGGSGSGKSTVAKLLAGHYQPWSGEILFDGKKREDWHRQVITNSMTMVDQDISLFEGTVREVVTLWDETISEKSLIQACKDAAIHDVISAKTSNYDYTVKEGGKNFSGGQRQRLEIARALVPNPSVLVLDEATSALDPTTEKFIDDNIKRRKCSVLVVAHRLSTIRDSNEIIVLDQGQIVERGTHEELKANQGKYWELITAE